MLVLTRHRNESVMIGTDVEMKVIDIRGDKVRVGFSAPTKIQIHRKEIFDEIRRENLLAAQMQPGDLPTPGAAITQQSNGPIHIDPFLRAAIDEAKQGLAEGGLPIGSVLVRDGKIIGRGHNRRVQQGDPMAHAEIDCLKNAGRQKTYKDTILYSTLMPCFLCSGAAVQFGVPKVIVGESVNFHGGHGKAGDSPDFMRSQGIDLTDLHDTECIDMMGQFIREHPDLWHEDIGAD
jgi:creatinine deaminase